jgi:hypothetical protein
MSSANTSRAPALNPSEKSKWEREYEALIAMFPDLFPEYEGQYVAMHEGHIVASGADEIEVAQAAYRQFGYQPIYTARVSRSPRQIARIPGARRVSNLTVIESE